MMEATETQNSSYGHVVNESAKLPGLVRIFLFHLWTGVVLYCISACAIGYMFISPHYYFSISAKVIFGALLAASVFLGVLGFRAATGLGGRHESAPRRCQLILILNFICGIIWLAFTIWGACTMRGPGGNPWDVAIPSIVNMLYLLVINEAWRRYFGTSSKVRAVFERKQDLQTDEASSRPEPEKTDASGEIGLVAVLCWLALIYRGVQSTLYLIYIFLGGGNVLGSTTLRFSISALVGIIAPLLILYAIKEREEKRSLVFWGLGLWLAASVVNYLIFTGGVLLNNGFDTSVMLQARFPSMINATEAIALAIWWYMTVSEKARAWFAEAAR